MSKHFREVHKQFVGDKTLAVQYMGIARNLLGGLAEMSADLFQNMRRVILPDGAVITVSFSGALSSILIDVRSVSESVLDGLCPFMESGAVYLTGEGETPAESWLVYGDDCRSSMSYRPVPLDYYGCRYNAASPRDSEVYSTKQDVLGNYVKADEKLAARTILRNLSGANFTGLMRMFVSAWLGSRPEDIVGTPSLLSTTRSVALVFDGGSKPVNESTGIYTYTRGDNTYFWMVSIAGSVVSYWPILFPAGPLLDAYKRETVAERKSRVLAYLFSVASFGDTQTTTITSPPAQPLAWGWHFNADGSKADIVLCESGSTTNQSWHWGLTISAAEDNESLSVSLTTNDASGEFVLTSAHMLFTPNGEGIQVVSDFGRSESYPLTDGYDPIPTYSNVPLYCFYRGDDLCLITITASYDEVGASVVTVGPADLSVQYLRVGLSKEVVTTAAYTHVASSMSVSTVGTYSGEYIGGNTTTFSEYTGTLNGGTRYWPGTVSEGVYCLGTTFYSWDMVYAIGTSSTGLTTHATTLCIPLVDAESVYVGNRVVLPSYTRSATRNGNVIDMTFTDSCGNTGDAAGYVYQYTFLDPLPDQVTTENPEGVDDFLFVGNRSVVDVGGNPEVQDYFYTVDNGLESRALISWGGRGESAAYYHINGDVLEVNVFGGFEKPLGAEFVNFIGWD